MRAAPVRRVGPRGRPARRLAPSRRPASVSSPSLRTAAVRLTLVSWLDVRHLTWVHTISLVEPDSPPNSGKPLAPSEVKLTLPQ